MQRGPAVIKFGSTLFVVVPWNENTLRGLDGMKDTWKTLLTRFITSTLLIVWVRWDMGTWALDQHLIFNTFEAPHTSISIHHFPHFGKILL